MKGIGDEFDAEQFNAAEATKEMRRCVPNLRTSK